MRRAEGRYGLMASAIYDSSGFGTTLYLDGNRLYLGTYMTYFVGRSPGALWYGGLGTRLASVALGLRHLCGMGLGLAVIAFFRWLVP